MFRWGCISVTAVLAACVPIQDLPLEIDPNTKTMIFATPLDNGWDLRVQAVDGGFSMLIATERDQTLYAAFYDEAPEQLAIEEGPLQPAKKKARRRLPRPDVLHISKPGEGPRSWVTAEAEWPEPLASIEIDDGRCARMRGTRVSAREDLGETERDAALLAPYGDAVLLGLEDNSFYRVDPNGARLLPFTSDLDLGKNVVVFAAPDGSHYVGTQLGAMSRIENEALTLLSETTTIAPPNAGYPATLSAMDGGVTDGVLEMFGAFVYESSSCPTSIEPRHIYIAKWSSDDPRWRVVWEGLGKSCDALGAQHTSIIWLAPGRASAAFNGIGIIDFDNGAVSRYPGEDVPFRTSFAIKTPTYGPLIVLSDQGEFQRPAGARIAGLVQGKWAFWEEPAIDRSVRSVIELDHGELLIHFNSPELAQYLPAEPPIFPAQLCPAQVGRSGEFLQVAAIAGGVAGTGFGNRRADGRSEVDVLFLRAEGLLEP